MTGPPTDKILAHRARRVAMLHILHRWYCASEGSIAVSWDELCQAVRTGEIPPSERSIRIALRDLISKGLVQVIAHSSWPDVQCYHLTSRGADFVRADFPWEKIDEFTGQQRFGG